MSKLTSEIDQLEIERDYWKRRAGEMELKANSLTAPAGTSWQVHLLRAQLVITIQERDYLQQQLESRTRMVDEQIVCLGALIDHIGAKRADEIMRKAKRTAWVNRAERGRNGGKP